jgi:hypothetical protein
MNIRTSPATHVARRPHEGAVIASGIGTALGGAALWLTVPGWRAGVGTAAVVAIALAAVIWPSPITQKGNPR